MNTITDEKALAEALKNDEGSIEIEGNLAEKTLKIKATGKVAWGVVCIGSIAVAVALIISYRGSSRVIAGAGAAVGLVSAGAATSILGVGATSAAIAIAVAGGGVGILNKLRDYKVERISDTHIKLIKK